MAENATSCHVSLTWTIKNAASPAVKLGTTTVAQAASGTTSAQVIPFGTSTVAAYDGTTKLAEVSITATCAANLVATNGTCTAATPPAPPVCVDGFLLNDRNICQKVVTDKTKALAAWGKLAQFYLVTKDRYVKVENATPWNVPGQSDLGDCGYRLVEPIDQFGIFHGACKSFVLGGGAGIWRALQVDPSTGKVTLSGLSPDAPNYVPANPADYQFTTAIDPATPDWAAKATIEAGTLFAYRYVIENGVSIMFQAKEGGAPVVVGAPQTYETIGTVRWMLSPQ